MRRALLSLIALAGLALPASASAQSSSCVSGSAAICVGGEKLGERAAAECRRAGGDDPTCTPPMGRRVSRAAIDAYAKLWTHRALASQYRLAHTVPLVDAPWVGTHNSFNSTSESPTVSHTDSNQQLSLTDQLDIDVRALEIDLHVLPGRGVVVCHGAELNAGCSTERTLRETLADFDGWLAAHPSEVLLLYLEDDISAPDEYAAAAADLNAVIGPRIYRPRPTATNCEALPLTLTRAAVLKAGKQVVLVSSCGDAAGWRGAVFNWDTPHVETGDSTSFDPGCHEHFTRATYDTRLVRYFEDSTWVSEATAGFSRPAGPKGITPAVAAAMTRCGVDLLGMDQLLPDDGRLDALVWSWARDEPRNGGCVMQRGSDGRWATANCLARRPAICRTAAGTWLRTRAVAHWEAARACATLGATFTVPRTGRQNELARGMPRKDAWLNERDASPGHV